MVHARWSGAARLRSENHSVDIDHATDNEKNRTVVVRPSRRHPHEYTWHRAIGCAQRGSGTGRFVTDYFRHLCPNGCYSDVLHVSAALPRLSKNSTC